MRFGKVAFGCLNRCRTFLQVQFPVYQELPQLPTPLGTLCHTQVFLIAPYCFIHQFVKLIVVLIIIIIICKFCHYLQFVRLPLVDRLTSLPLMAAGKYYKYDSLFSN